LMGGDGRVIPADVGQQVIERFEDTSAHPVRDRAAGHVTELRDTTTAHWEKIRPTVDVARIRQHKFKVLLDANHGSGAILGRRLLDELGCDVVLMGETADGQFAHPPEPTAENLVGVQEAVRQSGAAVGFCQDPDADRLAVIDASGDYLGEEYTMAMCVNHVLSSKKGAVVSNCSSSRMTQDVAERHGVPYYHAAVGEANVADKMIANQAVIGGEGNGGIIDPRVGYVRDSFVGMALLLDAMATRDVSIRALADELPRYAMVKMKLPLRRKKLDAALQALRNHFGQAEASLLDGLRLDWSESWLLIRASNTEPIVRIIGEAPTQQEIERLCNEAEMVIAGC
jgi:phosphomannomutase